MNQFELIIKTGPTLALPDLREDTYMLDGNPEKHFYIIKDPVFTIGIKVNDGKRTYGKWMPIPISQIDNIIGALTKLKNEQA